MPVPAHPERIEKMDAEARTLTPAVRSNADVNEFKSIAIVCGLGLLLSLILLRPGFGSPLLNGRCHADQEAFARARSRLPRRRSRRSRRCFARSAGCRGGCTGPFDFLGQHRLHRLLGANARFHQFQDKAPLAVIFEPPSSRATRLCEEQGCDQRIDL